MSSIDVWFRSEVARWRSGAALVWTLTLTTPVVYAAVATGNLTIWHPFYWIYASLLQVFSLWTWPYIMLVMLAIAILSVQNAKQFTVVSVVHSTRLEKLASIIRLRSMYYLLWNSVLCGVLAWAYTRLIRGQYYSLSKDCLPASEGRCLNEHHLFLVLSGAYLGLCHQFSALVSGANYLVFPIIQQSKFFQLKISAFSLVLRSAVRCLHWLKYFFLLYFLFLGSVTQNFFARNVGLVLGSEDVPINSFSGLLDFHLLWQCAVSGTFILGLLALSSQMFKLYHTEWHQFPIETSIQQYKQLCLHNALSCQSNNMVQYLGYQDLFMISRHSLTRRQQIFSLTKLGGHPQNWTNISSECLGLLQGFVEEVKCYNVKVMADGSMKHLAGENALMTSAGANNNVKQRNMSAGDSVSPTATRPQKPTALQMVTADLKKKKIVSFFIAEEPDVCSRKLFGKSQLYIWAVDALSYLTCASYHEDTFGVVQKTLPDIIKTLLDLQEHVEKHFRLLSTIGKRPESEHDSEAALRNALKTTLKAAIYRIATTFDSHIRSVPLSGEHTRRLNHFLEYKE